MAEAPNRVFKVLSEEEALAAGIQVELTEADKRPAPPPPGAMVVDQGIRSVPPKITVAEPPPEPVFVPWELLPQRTRDELEAGRKRVGGGLSAREIYERNKPARVEPVPLAVTPQLPDYVTAQQQHLTAQTKVELEMGRVRLAEQNAVRRATLDQVARVNAEKLKTGFKATGDEMNYFPEVG